MLIRMKLSSKQARDFKLITEKLFQTLYTTVRTSFALLSEVIRPIVNYLLTANTSVKIGCKIIGNSFTLYGEKYLYIKLKSSLDGVAGMYSKQKKVAKFTLHSQTGVLKIRRVRLLSEWDGKLSNWNGKVLGDVYYTE